MVGLKQFHSVLCNVFPPFWCEGVLFWRVKMYWGKTLVRWHLLSVFSGCILPSFLDNRIGKTASSAFKGCLDKVKFIQMQSQLCSMNIGF